MNNLQVTMVSPDCPKCNAPGVFMGWIFERVFHECTSCGTQYYAGHLQKAGKCKEALTHGSKSL